MVISAVVGVFESVTVSPLSDEGLGNGGVRLVAAGFFKEEGGFGFCEAGKRVGLLYNGSDGIVVPFCETRDELEDHLCF